MKRALFLLLLTFQSFAQDDTTRGSYRTDANGCCITPTVILQQDTTGTKPINADNPLPVTGTISTTPSASTGITPTDRTITSASGSSQTLMSANASRHSLTVANTGNANCGVNPTGGTAAIGGAGTLTLVPGGSYSPRIPTLSAVTVICTAAQPVYANES